MNAVAGSGFGRTTLSGPLVEGTLGALTLAGGIGTILSIGSGLLGSSVSTWFDLPSVLFAWLPLFSIVALGVGALLNASGRRSSVGAWRLAAALGLGASTLMLLVVSPAGVFMIPVALLAYVTAGVGQLRAQRGEAPASLAGAVLGGVATMALVAIIFLAVQTLPLFVR
jgi:hypothetical protein